MNPPHSAGTRRLVGTVALALAALGFGSQVVAGTVTGTVKDSVTNAVISGVKVMVTQQSARYANTNTSGVYSITSVTAGTVTLTASKIDYITQVTGNVVVPASGTVTAPLILLVKAGTITGTVVNASGGAAVSGATVKVTGTTTSTTTNSSGAFTLYQATGSYTLTVSLTGWVTATTGSFSVTNNQTTNVGAIPLAQTATVTGTVKESGTGTVLASVSVKLHSDTSKTATTNSSGVFTLNGIPVGTQSLDLSKSGYVSQTTASFSVVAGTNNVGDLLLVKSSGSITGIIQDAQAGNAGLAGATVTVNSVTPTISTTTAADGSYTLTGVPVGTRTVNASMTGYTARNTGNITVTEGQTANAGNLALTRTTVTVTGTVTDSATTAPISGATVSVQEQSGKTTTTNSSGAYTLTGVYWGTIHLNASKTNYTPKTAPMTLTAGNNTTQNIALDPITGAISGTVTDSQAGGAGVPGATVQINSVTPLVSTTTAADGSYTLTGVPVGTRTVNASAANHVAVNSGNVTVAANQTTTGVNLLLDRTTVTVSGAVSDSVSGNPLDGAAVSVQEQGGASSGTDGSGNYSISGVYWGSIHLVVSRANYVTKTVAVTLGPGAPATQNVALDSVFGSMTGVVVDATTGLGLIGARVNLNGDDSNAAETDWEGRYVLTQVPTGAQSVRAVLDGYEETSSGDVDVEPARRADVPAIRMPWNYGHIAGVVRDWDTGQPASDVVLVSARSGGILVTDSSGTFSFDWLEPGYDVISYQKAGATPMATNAIVIRPGQTASIDLTTRGPCGGPDGVVRGTVRDSAGAAIADATVTAVGFGSTQTAADGTYQISVPPGRHIVRGEKSGYRTIISDHHGDNSMFVSRDWQIVQDFVLPTLSEAGTVTVATTDPILRTPRQGSNSIESLSSYYMVMTNPAGESRTITDVPAGPLQGWVAPQTVTPGGSTNLDFHAASDAPTTTPRWAAGGLVYRATTGVPVAGATVTLASPPNAFSTTVSTDANGRWSFASGPVGDYQVTVEADSGLTSESAWLFTADDDGRVLTSNTGLVNPGDNGTLTIDEPTAGSVVGGSSLTVRATATLPKPGDYVLAANVSLSNTSFGTAPVVYELDGRHFRIDLTDLAGSGNQILTVTAITRYGSFTHGNWPVASVGITLDPSAGINSLSVDPTDVIGGHPSTGTVTLNAPAGSGGVRLGLTTSDPAAAVTPEAVTVSEGSSSAQFTVTTSPVASGTVVTITASAAGFTRTATLAIHPLSVASVSVSPANVLGGSPSSGTVTINDLAPSGGVQVLLSSSDAAAAAVPPVVTVPLGSTTTQFIITTSSVPSATVVTISAFAGGETRSADLEVGPLAPVSVALNPTTVCGGSLSTATVTLNGPAPAGGLAVSLSSSNPAVAVTPAMVTVPEGAVTAQFTATTVPVASGTLITISASVAGVIRTATLTLEPMAVASVAVSPDNVLGGTTSTATVTLDCPASSGGVQVALTSSDPASAAVAASVTVPEASNSAQFTITTSTVTSPKSVTITASGGGSTRSANLTVSPLSIKWFWFSCASVIGGNTCSVRVTLSFSAPVGGATVALTSANPALASLPAMVTIPDGQTSASGVVTTAPTGVQTTVVFTATLGDQIVTANLRVDPILMTSLQLSSPERLGGTTMDAYVFITSAAPTGGLIVTLTSDNPNVVTVPSVATVLGGQSSAWFVISTTQVATPTPVEIQATLLGQTRTATLTVNPLGPSYMTCSPTSNNVSEVVGGFEVTCRVSLNGQSPAGGFAIDLTTDNPIWPVPNNVTAAGGASSVTFKSIPATVSSPVAVTVSASTPNGMVTNTTSTVHQIAPWSVFVNPNPVAGGVSSTGQVSLNAPAPPGGVVVALSTDNAVATIPPSVSVAAGATNASFTITTVASAGPVDVTITATANGVIKHGVLRIGGPATLNRVTLPSSIGSGGTIEGTAWIDGLAPVGGFVVNLASDAPTIASVPASVTIPVNAASCPFSVSTSPVTSLTPVVISATANSVTKTTTMTLAPLVLAGLEIDLGSQGLAGGWITQYNEVTINGPAPVGGVSVSLSSSLPGQVAVPQSVLVPQGSDSADFHLTTGSVCSPTTAVVTATLGSVTLTGTFTVTPTEPRSITVTPSPAESGSTASALVALTGDPYAAGCQIVLATNDPTRAVLPTGVGNCVGHGDLWALAEYQCNVSVTIPTDAPIGLVTLTATGPTRTASTDLTVVQGTRLTGVAPADALPGDTLAVYGVTLAPEASAIVSGPVYDIQGDSSTPLCDLNANQCPSVEVPAVVNAGRTALSFVVPGGTLPGIYSLQVRDEPRQPSNSMLFAVFAPAQTRPALTAEQHQDAMMILPGETVTGTFTGDHPVEGVSDYNFYYFAGTAGSTINASLERADVSKPWEHPDSLDPELSIVAPDGYVYQNLFSVDNRPGVDLNASLHDAVLPLSGLYFVAVQTTRGHGDYRLSFSFGSHAPASEADRVVPVVGNYQTVPVPMDFQTATLILDPRGNPLSGAWVNFILTPAPEDRGVVDLTPLIDYRREVMTTPFGFAMKWIEVRGGGKMQFEPQIRGTFAASLSEEGVTVESLAASLSLPRYQPVAIANFSVREMGPDGTAKVAVSGYKRLTIERHPIPRKTRKSATKGQIPGHSPADPMSVSRSTRSAPQGTDGGPRSLDPDLGPADASTATSLPEVHNEGMVVTAQTISSCQTGKYAVAGTNPATPPPYILTLTDAGPSPGSGSGHTVGPEGIVGHRIGSTIRIRLGIRTQSESQLSQILVHVSVGGSRHGTVILDPDGARKECSEATFLWGDRTDTNGQYIFNKEFDYRLGTLATYVGVEPDPDHPGLVKPVWGTAETLTVTLQTANGPETAFYVHPEPGKPDHINSPDVYTYWSSYSTSTDAYTGRKVGGPLQTCDTALLKDVYDNTVYGDTNSAATQPDPNVFVHFTDQTSGAFGDFSAYTITTAWQADGAGQMPVGTYPSTLSVAYPDDPTGGWAAGTVSKGITITLQGGTLHELGQVQTYDQSIGNPGVDDLPFPLTVPPGADQGAMPKTVAGDTPRLVLLALAGSEIPSSVLQGVNQPSLDPNHVYRKVNGVWAYTQVSDPYPTLEVQDTTARFRMGLVDDSGSVIPGTKFRVHTCPRDEHLRADSPPGDCTDTPVDSGVDGSGVGTGLLEEFTLNAPGSQRGYMGIELTKAPINPGTYYIVVVSLGSTTYRIRQGAQLVSYSGANAGNDAVGGFAICNVMGGEILDENFQRVNLFTVNQPTRAYVRYADPTATGSTAQVDLHSYDSQGQPLDEALGVTLTRVGESSVFLSQPIELLPVWMESAAAPYLHVDRSPDGTVEVVPTPHGASGTAVVSAMFVASAASRRVASPACLAWAATASGGTYPVPLGVTLRLRVYWGFGLPTPEQPNNKHPFICSPDSDPYDCPTSENAFVALNQLEPMTLAEGGAEGDAQVARLENEPGPDPPQGWYLRAIRITLLPDGTPAKTDGTPRVPDGILTVTAPVVGGPSAVAKVKVVRPTALGTNGPPYFGISGYPEWPRTFLNSVSETEQTALLRDVIIDAADEAGMPPQYLAAQIYRESNFNPNTYRYEPTSRDFKLLSGDRSFHNHLPTMVEGGERVLLTTDRAYHRLGIKASSGNAEYLPCETDGTPALPDTNTPPVPCLPGRTPPEVPSSSEELALTQAGTDKWTISGLNGAKIQLGVTVHTSPGDPTLVQDFITNTHSDCAYGTLSSNQYCVEAESGFLRIGTALTGPATVTVRRTCLVQKDNVSNWFGYAAPNEQAQHVVELIRRYTSAPPADVHTTLRAWMLGRGTVNNGTLKGNTLDRYGILWRDDSLFYLIQHDPSFDVHGQWLAAASYGLMQLLPEDYHYSMRYFSDLQTQVFNTLYDPMTDAPIRLFDPHTCARLGAWDEVKTPADREVDDTACVNGATDFNQCTWERLWRRRLCKYNTGSQGDGTCGYANNIVNGEFDDQGNPVAPGVSWFMPQP
jgi:hypothetical protein